jgi:hypothetical protein
MKKLRRVILLLVLGVDLAILVVYWPALRPGKRHIYDRAGVIGWKEEFGNNQWLTAMQTESGVDIRIVVVPDSRGSTPEQFAVATMRELGIGRENGARGLLILYDTTARTVRIEVGPRLEGFLTDAFVGHMLRRHVDAFFNTGQTELGLRTILHMINWRIRQARLGREYDPSFEEYMRDVGGSPRAEARPNAGTWARAPRGSSIRRATRRRSLTSVPSRASWRRTTWSWNGSRSAAARRTCRCSRGRAGTIWSIICRSRPC